MPERRPRITRHRRGRRFVYRVGHRQVRRREELLRIARLAIPPAWSDVEISRSPSAKVLARGRDAEGRTQRIYNPAFRRRQERRKFERLPRFGEALPALRAQVERDLSRRHLGRKRVTAGAVRLIDGELLRVGNARSAEQRGSYGATTLQRRHVLLTSRTVRLDFVGKSGQRHQHTVQDRRLARLLRRLAEGPGPELFRFEDEAGVTHPLRSSHINAYLARHLGEEFTAKDFRTWGGTVVAAATLLGTESGEFESPASRAAALRAAVSAAAEKLGNTVAVTRSSYVDPRVLKAVEHPAVLDEVRRARARMRDRRHFPVDEQATQALLAAMEHPRG